MDNPLTQAEKTILLQHARAAIQAVVVNDDELPPIDLTQFSPALREDGASFVTLTRRSSGKLRGCIGTLTAYQPLIEDVREHAVAAALEDFRFLPVESEELPKLKIEISRLSKPILLDYANAEDLVTKIRPGIDGVVIEDGQRRATFLPQVWEKIPNIDLFLTALCQKMGASVNLWRQKKLDVSVYQVEEFSE